MGFYIGLFARVFNAVVFGSAAFPVLFAYESTQRAFSPSSGVPLWLQHDTAVRLGAQLVATCAAVISANSFARLFGLRLMRPFFSLALLYASKLLFFSFSYLAVFLAALAVVNFQGARLISLFFGLTGGFLWVGALGPILGGLTSQASALAALQLRYTGALLLALSLVFSLKTQFLPPSAAYLLALPISFRIFTFIQASATPHLALQTQILNMSLLAFGAAVNLLAMFQNRKSKK